jgi:hypothetical protein
MLSSLFLRFAFISAPQVTSNKQQQRAQQPTTAKKRTPQLYNRALRALLKLSEHMCLSKILRVAFEHIFIFITVNKKSKALKEERSLPDLT